MRIGAKGTMRFLTKRGKAVVNALAIVWVMLFLGLVLTSIPVNE